MVVRLKVAQIKTTYLFPTLT